MEFREIVVRFAAEKVAGEFPGRSSLDIVKLTNLLKTSEKTRDMAVVHVHQRIAVGTAAQQRSAAVMTAMIVPPPLYLIDLQPIGACKYSCLTECVAPLDFFMPDVRFPSRV